jgi:acetylornithine deacetylase/succinyl-diaminopimelate desuccinylase-like protein
MVSDSLRKGVASVSPVSSVVAISLVSFASVALTQRGSPAQQPDEITHLLQEYVRLDTSNPPGDTRQAADFLAAVFQRDGIRVERYESAPGKAIIYARLKATMTPPAGKAIVLLHHMDVVPADRSQWKTDPFTPTMTAAARGDGPPAQPDRGAGVPGLNNVLWGRGAFDMKGQAVAQILAFLRLKRENVPLNRDLILLAHPDEEVGGAMGARWMIANHYAELDPEYVIDEGGFGSRDLFAPGKLVYGIAVAEKKIVWLKVRADGVAGHGSQPHDQNPNDRLVRAVARLLDGSPERAVPRPQETASAVSRPFQDENLIDVMRANVGAFANNKFTNAIQRSTIAVTWLRSGVGDPPKINVIPSFAEVGLDCRVVPGTTKDQWIAEVSQRLGDPSLKLELINESDDPIVSPRDTPLYRNIEAAIKARHPDAIVTPMLIPYGTDSNAFRPKGVKSYGIFPAIVSADTIAGMHSDSEHISLDNVREAADVFFDALRATLSMR